jgi:hypothetical protein
MDLPLMNVAATALPPSAMKSASSATWWRPTYRAIAPSIVVRKVDPRDAGFKVRGSAFFTLFGDAALPLRVDLWEGTACFLETRHLSV